jgi:hypothetical protein
LWKERCGDAGEQLLREKLTPVSPTHTTCWHMKYIDTDTCVYALMPADKIYRGYVPNTGARCTAQKRMKRRSVAVLNPEGGCAV